MWHGEIFSIKDRKAWLIFQLYCHCYNITDDCWATKCVKRFSIRFVDASVIVVYRILYMAISARRHFSKSRIPLGNVLHMVFHVPVIGADSVIQADSGHMVGSDGCWSWYASGIAMLLFYVLRTPHNVIENRIRTRGPHAILSFEWHENNNRFIYTAST